MAKDPAFLFYSSDFLTGTMLFTTQERGQYITLLSVIHQQGRLSLEEIEIVLRENVSTRVLSKFRQDETGLYFNERLETESNKRKAFTESRRNSLSIENGDMVYIYILFDNQTDNFKIGSSKYPELRLQEVQKKRPHVKLYWKTEVLVERIEEKRLHEQFAEKRVKNDWFRLTNIDLGGIIGKFRTGLNNSSRTDTRTENENENENTNALGKDGGTGEGKPPDGTITWDQEKENFFNDGGWQIKFTSHKGISFEQLQKLMQEFVVDLELKQDYKPKKELQAHFTNLFNKQKNVGNQQSNFKKGPTGTPKNAGANKLAAGFASKLTARGTTNTPGQT